MELTKLFEVQLQLDAEIEQKHPTEKMERVDKKFLAMFTEFGECANEWRGFKFWSNDQEPRIKELLEEYVDPLHFILSLGLEFGFETINFRNKLTEYEETIERTVTRQFNSVIYRAAQFESDHQQEDYVELVLAYLALGEMLGFSCEQIETAYLEKNQVNHERQANGY